MASIHFRFLISTVAIMIIDAAEWNKIQVEKITPNDPADATDPKKWRGYDFEAGEVERIFTEATNEFYFLARHPEDKLAWKEAASASFAVKYPQDGTVDVHLPFRVPDTPLNLNLVQCHAHDFTFFIRKNKKDGSKYTLFFPRQAENSGNRFISRELIHYQRSEWQSPLT